MKNGVSRKRPLSEDEDENEKGIQSFLLIHFAEYCGKLVDCVLLKLLIIAQFAWIYAGVA